MPDLNPRHIAFVTEFLVDFNATQAAIRVGYSPKTANREGSRLMSNADIAAAVAEKFKERISAVDLSVERVLAGLYEEATRTGEGSSHGARVAAWSAIAKHFGMFIERQEVTITHRFTELSDAELRFELAALLGKNRSQGVAKGH